MPENVEDIECLYCGNIYTKEEGMKRLKNLIIDSKKKKMEKNKMKESTNEEQEGAFLESLKRNNSKIRKDRAQSISEDTEIIYKRAVEDLELSIKRMKRELENMLDLSPTNAQSLILASDFNSGEYVEKDIELGVKIRNSEIKLEIAKKRYNYLFGQEVK